jgi:hypothetical protein
MSRTYKNNFPFYYRSFSGWKRALINKARPKTIPPNSWDDIRVDEQCHQVSKNVEKMFKNGVEIEEIERKLRKKRKISYWIWRNIIEWKFNNCIIVKFKGHIGINKEGIVVPLSTPYANPYPIINLKNTPLNDFGEFIVITENKLFRYLETELRYEGPYGIERVEIKQKKLFPFRNKKLTKILLYIKELYYNHGMKIEEFMVKKWRMGLDKSDIKPIYYS